MQNKVPLISEMNIDPSVVNSSTSCTYPVNEFLHNIHMYTRQGFENTLTVFGLPLDLDVLSSSGFDCSFELISKFLCVSENSTDFFC